MRASTWRGVKLPVHPSLQPKHAIAGVSLHLPQRRGISAAEFLVFNQELATLLRAGMPPRAVARSLLRRRVDIADCSARVLDDVHEKVRAGTALSDAFATHGDQFPRVYTASLLARGAQRQPRRQCCAAMSSTRRSSRRVKRKTCVGAGLSGHSRSRSRSVLVSIIVLKVVPAFCRFLHDRSAPSCRWSPGSSCGVSDLLRHQFICHHRRDRRRWSSPGVRLWVRSSRAEGAARSA